MIFLSNHYFFIGFLSNHITFETFNLDHPCMVAWFKLVSLSLINITVGKARLNCGHTT